MRIIVRERKEREFDPTTAFLRDCVESREFAREDPGTQKRLRETLALMESLASWAEQMLAMDNSLLKRLLKLGARVQAFLKSA